MQISFCVSVLLSLETEAVQMNARWKMDEGKFSEDRTPTKRLNIKENRENNSFEKSLRIKGNILKVREGGCTLLPRAFKTHLSFIQVNYCYSFQMHVLLRV